MAESEPKTTTLAPTGDDARRPPHLLPTAERKFAVEVMAPGFITLRNLHKDCGLIDSLKFNPIDNESIDINVDHIVAICNELSMVNGYLNIILSSGARVYIHRETGVRHEDVQQAIRSARAAAAGGSALPK